MTDPIDEFYYSADGDRIPLRREPDLAVVRYAAGTQLNARAQSSRDVLSRSRTAFFAPSYRLQVYVKESSGRARALRSIAEDDSVEFAAPAYYVGGGKASLAFGLNQFAIEFKLGHDTAAALQRLDDLNAEHGVQYLETMAYSEPRLGLLLGTPNGDGPFGPAALARLYYETLAGDLLYALPDMVRRRKPRDRGNMGQWPYQAEQWHLDVANVPAAWADHGLGDSTINLAVIDNGVEVGHSEFVGNVGPQYDFSDWVADGTPKLGSERHGTACAGVAVANGLAARGVAPGARVMAVRFPELMGSADEANMFYWAADAGADIISCSWGPDDGRVVPYPLPDNVRSAISYCVTRGRGGRGIPIFWASGNGGESMETDGYVTNPDVMSVGAVTEHREHAYYSDYGKSLFISAPSSGNRSNGDRAVFTTDRTGALGYNRGGNPDLEGLYTGNFTGTSAAAPLVAGVAALMLSVQPQLSVSQVRSILRETARKTGDGYGASGHSPQFGYGIVDAHAAVSAAKSLYGGAPTQYTNAAFSISAPDALGMAGAAPVFSIDAPIGWFWAVEVATSPFLLDAANRGAQRNSDNFFASWARSGLLRSNSYALPQDVWDRLSNASALYYRLWVSARQDEWLHPSTTTPDTAAGEAPALILRAQPPVGEATIQAPQTIPRGQGVAIFNIQLLPGQSAAVELASEAFLLDPETGADYRDDDNFYGSWTDRALMPSGAFQPSEATWRRLSRSGRVFYRLITSEAEQGWVDPRSVPEVGTPLGFASVRIL